MKRAQRVLTMITDWGLSDHYVGSFKGKILSILPQVQIIDISHDVEKHNILHAAYMIRNSYLNFPDGSIHFIGLNGSHAQSAKQKQNPLLGVQYASHIFVGRDSGIFSLIFGQDSPSEIYTLIQDGFNDRFESKNGLINILAALLEGESLNKFGEKQESVHQIFLPQAAFDENGIKAAIIFTDSFGNLITNVRRDEFERARKGRSVNILLRRAFYQLSRISYSYEDAPVGEMVAFFNEDGFMEIALNQANAAGLLGIKVLDSIRIEFND
jgi:S-adenosylmethionine hydrolase